jgi:hypothetical protein
MNRRMMTRAFLPHANVAYPWLPDPEGVAGGDGGQGGSTGGDDKGGSEYKPPASQADLDRIITERLARERSKFADYDDLKTKAAEFDRLAEASKTEQERAVEQARTEARTEALTVANTRIVSAEARALAAAARFRNPTDAVAFLDLKTVKVGDDGTPDSDALKAALATLAKDKPYLVEDEKPGKPKPDLSQGASQGERAPGAAGAAEAAKRFGTKDKQ